MKPSFAPLGLPKGTVRSVITLAAVGIYLLAVTLQMFYPVAIPEALSTIVMTVIAFYFGVRTAEDRQG